jgi:uncharacterized protein YciI
MPLYTIIGRDGPEGAERRKRHRDAHLAGLAPLVASGRVRFAGPLLGPDGAPAGSLIVIEAPDLAAARVIAERDPYVTQGVFASFEVSETRQVFPEGPALGVFEALGSARAMRRLRPDPVPDELIDKLIWAATRASNPGNSQGWDFVVVRDVAQKRALRDAIAAGMQGFLASLPRAGGTAAERRMIEGARHLVDGLDRVPVLIAVCASRVYPPDARPLRVERGLSRLAEPGRRRARARTGDDLHHVPVGGRARGEAHPGHSRRGVHRHPDPGRLARGPVRSGAPQARRAGDPPRSLVRGEFT